MYGVVRNGDVIMPIVGFNFTKLSGEKKGKFTLDKKIKSDLKIVNVDKENLDIGKSDEIAKFEFEFIVDYQDVGNMLLGGNVLFMDDPKKVNSILDNWKKKKKMPEEIMNQILNTILFRCNIKALNVSQDLGLPPHFRLPRVVPKTK